LQGTPARFFKLNLLIDKGKRNMSGENSQNGINVHLPYNRLGILDRCKGSGIAWVRIDLNWDSIAKGSVILIRQI